MTFRALALRRSELIPSAQIFFKTAVTLSAQKLIRNVFSKGRYEGRTIGFMWKNNRSARAF